MKVSQNQNEFRNFDQPAGRAKNTTYQNTGAKPMLVVINVAGDESEFRIGNVDPPVIAIAKGTSGVWQTITAVVPGGYYYRLVETGAISVTTWSEYT